jgi:molecular chaperone HtpG
LAETDEVTFAKVWNAFGAVIKEGIYEDVERRERLLALSRFTSTVGDGPRSLEQYVADFRPSQTEIYYLLGDTLDRLRSNPVLEAARARGIEVLLLTDHIDAFWTSLPLDYDGKPLKSLTQDDVNFDLIPLVGECDDQKQATEEDNAGAVDEAVILMAVKAALEARVADVRASRRLTDSPSCLVSTKVGPDRHLQRILAHTGQMPAAPPVLELNMKHPLVRGIAEAKATGKSEDVADLSHLLLEQAQILDGEIPADPAAFAARLNRLVQKGL